MTNNNPPSGKYPKTLTSPELATQIASERERLRLNCGNKVAARRASSDSAERQALRLSDLPNAPAAVPDPAVDDDLELVFLESVG